jgi:hypothetical protein
MTAVGYGAWWPVGAAAVLTVGPWIAGRALAEKREAKP